MDLSVTRKQAVPTLEVGIGVGVGVKVEAWVDLVVGVRVDGEVGVEG